MALFRVPIDSQDVMFWILGAMRQLVGKQWLEASRDSPASYRLSRKRCVYLRRFCTRVYSTIMVLSPGQIENRAQRMLLARKSPDALWAELRYPLSMQALFDTSELASPVGTIL